MSDFSVNFVFGRGVSWIVPKENEAIVPAILDRAWNQDNDAPTLLWELGQMASVCGDGFAKVAYEESWTDPAGGFHPGRVRIIPLNPSFCMPTEDTEALTRRGWLSADEICVGDEALALDPETDELVWATVEAVNIFDWDGPLHEWRSKYFSALTTPDHKWVTHIGSPGASHKENPKLHLRSSSELHDLKNQSLFLAGGHLSHFPHESPFSDFFVELVGWAVSEGWFGQKTSSLEIGQSSLANAHFCARIEKVARHFESQGYRVTRTTGRADSCDRWYFPAELGRLVKAVLGPDKEPLPAFLTSLTEKQARLLFNTLLDGDGDTKRGRGRERLYQCSPAILASVQMLAMLLGKRSISKLQKVSRNKFGDFDGTVGIHQSRTANMKWMKRSMRHYTGRVWCPTTSVGTWVVRRKEVIPPSEASIGDQGNIFKHTVFLTGNCFPE